MEGAVWKDQLSGQRGGKVAAHRRLPAEHRSQVLASSTELLELVLKRIRVPTNLVGS